MLRALLYRTKVTSIDQLVYRLTHGRWRRPSREARPGYTLLLTVPPDLPVFLKLALHVCRRQDLTGLVETLVIPDRATPGFAAVFSEAATGWEGGPIRLVNLGGLDGAIRSRTTNTSVIHWLQIINACAAATSTHALLHDVDLFLFDPNFFRNRYETCLARDLRCLGVTIREDMALGVDAALGRTSSDRVVFPELSHLLSTWELCFDVRWARSFRPSQLRPQYVRLNGRLKHLDTLHLAQLRAGPARVACLPAAGSLLHFGGVITEYRFYQWAEGRPFLDRRFRLLLIRLLIDAFDPERAGYDLPDAAELAQGLGDPARKVHYGADDSARENYAALRGALERLLASDLIDEPKAAAIRAGLNPFDRFYAIHPA